MMQQYQYLDIQIRMVLILIIYPPLLLNGIETGKKKDDGFGVFAWIISGIFMLIVGASLTFLLIRQGMPDTRAKGIGMLVWFVGTGILKNRIQRWVKKINYPEAEPSRY